MRLPAGTTTQYAILTPNGTLYGKREREINQAQQMRAYLSTPSIFRDVQNITQPEQNACMPYVYDTRAETEFVLANLVTIADALGMHYGGVIVEAYRTPFVNPNVADQLTADVQTFLDQQGSAS